MPNGLNLDLNQVNELSLHMNEHQDDNGGDREETPSTVLLRNMVNECENELD